jgi:hypothetical protein
MRHDSPLRCIARSHDSSQYNIALSRLRAMQHSMEFLLKIFSIEIMLEFIARISSAILGEKNSTLCNIARSHDSAPCNLARSHDSALCCIARSQNCIAQNQLTELWLCATAFKSTIKQNFTLPYSSKMKKNFWLRAMLQSTESTFSTVCGRISPRIRNGIKKYFRVLTTGIGAVDLWKNQKSKISWDCLFKCHNSPPLITIIFFLLMSLKFSVPVTLTGLTNA